MRSVILACPGPSIAQTDVFAPGHDVCAVSSGIMCIDRPKMWCVVDGPRGRYLRPDGYAALRDESVIKYLPCTRKKEFANCPNVTIVKVYRGQYEHRPSFMDGSGIMLARPHKTICFAVQVMLWLGYERLIFAGCDGNDVYAHGRALDRQARKRLIKGHEAIADQLRKWQMVAAAHGREFLSWTPESLFNDFMSRYDPTTDSPCVPQAAQGTVEEAAA